jgi:hypothetical protein
MDLPTPPQAVAALASFVRERLADVSGGLAPLLRGRDGHDAVQLAKRDFAVLAAAQQFATVVVGAAAPFAPTSYSRARLIRQMHASGLLSADEVRRTGVVLELGERDGEASGTYPAAAAAAAPGAAGRGASGRA